jgi:hypothetical protein
MRLLAALVGAIVLAALVLVGLVVAGVNPPGCRWHSVDKDRWEAANLALLDDIPVYPGSTRGNADTLGYAVAKDVCFAGENSGPYGSWMTNVNYALPVGATSAHIVAFYDEELRNRGWTLRPYGPSDERTYYRGEATLVLRTPRPEGYFEFRVIHDQGV